MAPRYDISIAPRAQHDALELIGWLAARSPVVASGASADLQFLTTRDLELNPKRFAYFWLSGPPFRARLYHLSRRTKYWIVNAVDDELLRVMIVRIWNASRDPAAFEL